MKFGYGLITCQRTATETRSDVELYRDAVESAELAERLGFDSVWLSEHHFVDDGYMPSVLPVAAAIAPAPSGCRSARRCCLRRCTIRCGWPRMRPPST